MKCNLGQTEKYVRLVLGTMLFALGVFAERNFSGMVGQVLLWLSLFLLLTAAFSWCPFTSLRLRHVSSKVDEGSQDVPPDVPSEPK